MDSYDSQSHILMVLSCHNYNSHVYFTAGNGICNCGNCECWDGWNGNACEIWLGTEYP